MSFVVVVVWLVSSFWIVESAVDDFYIVPVNRQYISKHFARERRHVASCVGLLLQGNHTSVIGLDARTLSSTRVLLPDLLTTAKYLIVYRADTVLPAPDSPLTMMDWFLWFLRKKKKHCFNKTVYSIICGYLSFHSPGHLFVSLLCHSEDMWVHVAHVLTAVGIDDVWAVDWQSLVRVDGHQNDS